MIEQIIKEAIEKNNTKKLVNYLPFKIYVVEKDCYNDEELMVRSYYIRAISRNKLIWVNSYYDGNYDSEDYFGLGTYINEYKELSLQKLKSQKWAMTKAEAINLIEMTEKQKNDILTLVKSCEPSFQMKFLDFIKTNFTYNEWKSIKLLRKSLQEMSDTKIFSYFNEEDFRLSGKYYIQSVSVLDWMNLKTYSYLTTKHLITGTKVKIKDIKGEEHIGKICETGYFQNNPRELYWLENILGKKVLTGKENLKYTYSVAKAVEESA